MEFVKFKIEGMTCDHCAQAISKKFRGKKGIGTEEISYPDGYLQKT